MHSAAVGQASTVMRVLRVFSPFGGALTDRNLQEAAKLKNPIG
jgi:hypothetical protein